jgi:hypothetical protein
MFEFWSEFLWIMGYLGIGIAVGVIMDQSLKKDNRVMGGWKNALIIFIWPGLVGAIFGMWAVTLLKK